MQRREWTQADFARQTGFTTGTISRWWRGERIPDPASCDLIADVLHIDVEEVLRQAGHLPDIVEDSEVVRELIARIRRIRWTPDRQRMVTGMLDSMIEYDKSE